MFAVRLCREEGVNDIFSAREAQQYRTVRRWRRRRKREKGVKEKKGSKKGSNPLLAYLHSFSTRDTNR